MLFHMFCLFVLPNYSIVFFQGCIIAFTSNFIPRLVYAFVVSENNNLDGFLNHSLAYFNMSDLEKGNAPYRSEFNITVCRSVFTFFPS